MTWNSFSEFVVMGGYAQYVWGSFGACALGFLLEPVLVRQRQN
ncbi:MAG: heme exporter protein CcmD, partial [Sulfuritalea sp.]|nr:heme exporter protein CcmD [Sulfuritalea sp.]